MRSMYDALSATSEHGLRLYSVLPLLHNLPPVVAYLQKKGSTIFSGGSGIPMRTSSTIHPITASVDTRLPPSQSGSLQKRPLPSEHPSAERQLNVASLAKIPKRSSIASPQSPDRVENNKQATVEDRPPAWYRDLKVKNTRGKDDGDADTLLKSLKTQIAKCQQNNISRATNKPALEAFEQIRNKLHSLVFKEVSPSMLKLNRILHKGEGLELLFEKDCTKGVNWPFDIQADAHELYNKWASRDFSTDLYRGIKVKIQTADDKRAGNKTSDSIDPRYSISYKYHGNGTLLNGQWWPTQLCTLRDGAHGSSQGGISGNRGKGAYSCIMSGGHAYADIDNGDEVFYCGTDSTNGQMTDDTQRMVESATNHRPIRLIRSHNLRSQWAPIRGFRYDGLYQVVSFENLDGPTSLRQRHRFHLVRQADQDPIRGGTGPERRPTDEEVAEWEKHQVNAGKAKKA